jgi:hypothetical protein
MLPDRESSFCHLTAIPLGKYAYLVDGIRSMLASRLSARAGVQLVDYNLRESEIKKMVAASQDAGVDKTAFTALQTDYLVTGILYATNTGLKIQVNLSSVEESTSQNISSVMENEEQVISAVTTLVEEIHQKISGVPGTEAGQRDDAVAEAEGISGFRTEHPEKQYKKGALGGAAIVGADGVAGDVSAKGVKRSSTIPSVIVSMDVGDLDGDGRKEIVFASSSSVQVYHFVDDRFQKLGELDLLHTYKIHALNIADLDGDGRAEIIVSANERLDPSSMILSWSAQSGMKTLSRNIRWYLRPMLLPGEGMILAGQYGNVIPEQGFVQPGVYKLSVGPGFSSIERGARIPLPSSVNLFDFTRVDLDADGTVETVVIDRNEKLLVYDNQNNLLWVSDEEYGGSRNYVGTPKRATIGNRSMAEKIVFVPTKLLVQDVDGDGKPEIIIGRNKRVSYRFLENTRAYEGGNIACLAWDNTSMRELWRTNTIAGYIADYNFSFVNPANNQEPAMQQAQLHVGQVPANTFLGVLTAKESKLLVYEIAVKTPGESGAN